MIFANTRRKPMKILFLVPIAVFLVFLPWFQGISVGLNNDVMIDGITTSSVVVMTITLVFSLISWCLISWAAKGLSLSGILIAIILGASIVIPFFDVLGPMAGVILGVVAGFLAFIFEQTIHHNRFAAITVIGLAITYVILTVLVLTSSQTSHVWDTDDGIGSWSGTAEGIEKSGFENFFDNNIGFVFFLVIVPSLIITQLIIREKKIMIIVLRKNN